MHKHLPYSSLKVKGMTVFKHSTVMMKAAREGFISGMYELFTQENNLKVLKISLYSGTLQSSWVWCAWGLGITCCFLLSCLQMLWQAERGQRALFHTSARNVINISKGNICHPPHPSPLSYLHCMDKQTFEPDLTWHTSAEGDEVVFMWNNERIHAM